MENLKTLVSCKPSEFLKQTNRIRKSAQNWMEVTKIAEIRKELPELEKAPAGASKEELEAIDERNKEALRKQSRKNIQKMLDSVLDEHPDETLEILALCCFVEPEHIDDYPVQMYLEAFNEIIGDEAVLNFFTSLAQLVGMLG